MARDFAWALRAPDNLLLNAYINAHLTYFFHFGEKNIAATHRADALRRPSQDHITRMKRVERGSHLDQLANAQDEIVGVGVLSDFPIHRNSKG